MHADDTNYTVIKNGIVVVSGTGPAIRVDGKRLVIRDGPQETKPLILTRAEASRKLRHVIVCGREGGFVTFPALKLLRDTGVAFSQLDYNGAVIIASGPRGPDQPALRRAQALVCSGVIPQAAVSIACEILRVKLRGQAEVARLLGSAETGEAIDDLAAAVTRESDGSKALAIESRAASMYWKLWEEMPVKFARRNPQRLGLNGKWRPGRSDPWLTFGQRTSILTGKPHRATTPGNALLNYLYAILEAEMTVALLAASLDCGIGMFHVDLGGRSSAVVDTIEAVRPYVDYWLAAYLSSSVFANRDFTELPDGEVRLTHPLSSHLAHTAMLWRKACEPVAGWLAHAFGQAARIGPVLTLNDRALLELQSQPTALPQTGRRFPTLSPPLPNFFAPRRSHSGARAARGALRDSPVPRTCVECGRALSTKQRKFCSQECVTAFSLATNHFATIARVQPGEENKQHRIEKARAAYAARRQWIEQQGGQQHEKGRIAKSPTSTDPAVMQWFAVELHPMLTPLPAADIARALAVSHSYSLQIKHGRVPHPRHFAALASLVGVEPPAGYGSR
jgi:CRISPR/Cas system-associated endonuclease Cas1